VRPKNQFSLTRAAPSTSGRAKNQILISKNVTGTLRVKLYKGNIMCAGRKSPVSLCNPAIATMEADPTKAYNQDDATGFIRLNALRLKVAARVQRRK
jgi:argininosuccinate synthase